MTVVTGVMARSVRDIARHLDVTSGYDPHDPYSLPKRPDWEANLGSYREALAGKRVVVVPDLGSAIVNPRVAELVAEHAASLIADAGLVQVDVEVAMPSLGFEWALANLCHLRHELGDRWPDCKDLLTTEIAFGLEVADQVFNLSVMGAAEAARTRANSALGDLFSEVDFVISATNPDVAFPAELGLNTRVADKPVGAENNGALTIPYNIVGSPAVTIPIGLIDGLPVGMQVAARHHADELLLDLALIAERERPWPLIAGAA
jgi:aspartyl-tRNA(Asn)/glutamyl-tRNA(Gln) amidotransferase subunit A